MEISPQLMETKGLFSIMELLRVSCYAVTGTAPAMFWCVQYSISVYEYEEHCLTKFYEISVYAATAKLF